MPELWGLFTSRLLTALPSSPKKGPCSPLRTWFYPAVTGIAWDRMSWQMLRLRRALNIKQQRGHTTTKGTAYLGHLYPPGKWLRYHSWRYFKNTYMCCLGTWFSAGHCNSAQKVLETSWINPSLSCHKQDWSMCSMTGIAMWHSYTWSSYCHLDATVINHIRASETRANGLCKMESDQRVGPRDHTAENWKGELPPALLHICIPRRAINWERLMVALKKAVHPPPSTSWTVRTTLEAAGGWQVKTNQIREVTGPRQSPVHLCTLLAGLWYLQLQ